jgi:hypothetical protein
MKRAPNEYRYAVAIREGDKLWVTLRVRRSAKGEFFVCVPRADGKWDPHVSYHSSGACPNKSYNKKYMERKLQPLTVKFIGTEYLIQWAGHGGTTTPYEPTHFNGVVEVPHGVLSPRNGSVLVDLVEPGKEPRSHPGEIVQTKVLEDFEPHVVIRIAQ